MKKRKIFIVLFAFLFCFLGQCFAFEIDQSRWAKITAENDFIVFVDTDSIVISERDSTTRYAWICFQDVKEKKYVTQNVSLKKDGLFHIMQELIWDENGDFIYGEPEKDKKYIAEKNTLAEKLVKFIFGW